tara:strand:- start:1358 stop:1861 length:504 start_codon:yes stop_codon:yes gene_type:complete
MADCEDLDERPECYTTGGDTQLQYGRRFVDPSSCTEFQINTDTCPADPANVCTQVDENKPLPSPDSGIERPPCKSLFSTNIPTPDGEHGFYLDVMGWKPPRTAILMRADGTPIELSDGSFATRKVGDMIAPINPADLEARDEINPTMKVEVNKKMCSLKEYSFTIGD